MDHLSSFKSFWHVKWVNVDILTGTWNNLVVEWDLASAVQVLSPKSGKTLQAGAAIFG